MEMRQILVLALIAGLPLASLLGGFTRAETRPPLSLAGGTRDFAPLSEDFAVIPDPDGYANSARPTVSLRIVNASRQVLEATLRLSLDARPLVPSWDAGNRTIWSAPVETLPDGIHVAHFSVQETNFDLIEATWSFTTDTVVPQIAIPPLPPVADERVFTIRGNVTERNLAEVFVNGFPASLQGDRFLVPVLLWPGHNDLLSKAVDRAGNEGFAKGEIAWHPFPPLNAAYKDFRHANASFATRFPSTWDVQLDSNLAEGFRADVVVRAPPSGLVQSSVAVVSSPAGAGMSDGLLLSILQVAILNIAAHSKVDVVSSPRPVEIAPGASAAQFSVVQTLPEGPRVFLLVTGFWSRTLNRIWLVIGSISSDQIEAHWYAVQTAVDSFRVLEPPSAPYPGETPARAVDRALLVTIGAIVFLSAFFVASLYSWRIGPRANRRPTR